MPTFQQAFLGQLPPLPAGQHLMDFLSFKIGNNFFCFVSALNERRDQPALCRIFKLVEDPKLRLDPKPIFSRLYFHARNIAVVESNHDSVWLWVADHGADIEPYTGGSSPLFQIFGDGRCSEHNAPLLKIDQFSFDGIMWKHPNDGSTWLFQCNIGRSPPRLLRWTEEPEKMTDESSLLPKVMLDQSRRFLVSRQVGRSDEGILIYLGNDDSLETPIQSFPKDALLQISWCIDAESKNIRVNFDEDVLPDRPREASWSTVELLEQSNLWLALTHNRGWSEGAAVIYQVRLEEKIINQIQIRAFPDLAATQHWAARAAISPNTESIIIYLRNPQGQPIAGSKNNTLWLRRSAAEEQIFVSNNPEFGIGYFVGGFFWTNDHCIQLNSLGQLVSFRLMDLPKKNWLQSFLSRRMKTF